MKNHIIGRFRSAAHDACNKKLRINPKTIQIPIVFHNLKGYDAPHLMQAMSKVEGAGELNCIAKNMEKYISFSLGNLRFIDSNAFLLSSLDALVKATPKEALKITKTLCPEPAKLDLLCKQGTRQPSSGN